MALHFTQLRVLVFPRNNGPNQRWSLERVGADGSVEASTKASTVSMVPPSVTATFSVLASGEYTTVRKFYFGTRPLNAEDLTRCVSVRLETDAHNPRGGDPSEGMCSWFEVAILRSVPQTGESAVEHIKTHKNVPLTWRSHVLPLQDDYIKQFGLVFDRTHPLWANLEVGDVIGVLACAKNYSWTCEARSGELRFERNAL
ncbi:hypothetical protein OG21DRAFT_1245989 [Imleria badia]|nr:hypothetical protein OG21DRAFT_1245989 [Imleria badia]